MSTLGVSVVLSWDVASLANAGVALLGDSQSLRDCFADFRGHSDLEQAWSGAAADAQTADAKRLAADLFAGAELLGAISSYINEQIPAIESAQNTIKRYRGLAEAENMQVAEDGTVGNAPPLLPLVKPTPGGSVPGSFPGSLPGILQTPEQQAQSKAAYAQALKRYNDAITYTKAIQAALKAATAADDELASAISHAHALAEERAGDPVLVSQAVAYVAGDAIDPFLSDEDGAIEPNPNSPNFLTWLYAQLPSVRQMIMAGMSKQIWPDGFDPYSTIQGGTLPQWATDFNDMNLGTCVGPPGAPNGATGYGYFGGGTIAGPGGVQWPIVIPYYSDGKSVYTIDGGGPNGIAQGGGKDPGWRTVYTASGQAPYGSTSRGTNLLVGLSVLTGADIQTTHTDPGSIYIDPNGIPHQGSPPSVGNASSTIANQPYWNLDTSSDGGNAAALGLQGGQAIATVNNLNSQASRQWYVSYQVNDDGRTRAIVNTYSSATTSDGHTVVAGLASTFPDGKHSSTELPVNVHVQPGQAYAYPQSNVVYAGNPTLGGGTLTGTQAATQSIPH